MLVSYASQRVLLQSEQAPARAAVKLLLSRQNLDCATIFTRSGWGLGVAVHRPGSGQLEIGQGRLLAPSIIPRGAAIFLIWRCEGEQPAQRGKARRETKHGAESRPWERSAPAVPAKTPPSIAASSHVVTAGCQLDKLQSRRFWAQPPWHVCALVENFRLPRLPASNNVLGDPVLREPERVEKRWFTNSRVAASATDATPKRRLFLSAAGARGACA